MNVLFNSWQFWALMAAVFAALTNLFAKIGVEEINPDFATLIRTSVVLVALVAIVLATRQAQPLSQISRRSLVFLVLSGLATGASWVSYFRALRLGEVSQVAPLDKLSVVFVALLGVLLLGEKLTGINWLGIGMITAGALLVAIK